MKLHGWARRLLFYMILSLAPLIILLIPIVALIFGHSTAQNHLLGEVESMIGHQGSDAVKGMIEHAQKPAAGMFASIIGVITLLFGASGVFSELRSALNKMWDLKPESEGGVWGTIKQRFFSFGMVGRWISSTGLVGVQRCFGGARQVFWRIPADARVRTERDRFCGFIGGDSRVIRAYL